MQNHPATGLSQMAINIKRNQQIIRPLYTTATIKMSAVLACYDTLHVFKRRKNRERFAVGRNRRRRYASGRYELASGCRGQERLNRHGSDRIGWSLLVHGKPQCERWKITWNLRRNAGWYADHKDNRIFTMDSTDHWRSETWTVQRGKDATASLSLPLQSLHLASITP